MKFKKVTHLRKRSKKKQFNFLNTILILIIGLLIFTSKDYIIEYVSELSKQTEARSYQISELPVYDGHPYVYINNNKTYFNDEYDTSKSFEFYSELDSLGRCGVAVARVGLDTMPTEERESIGMIKPSGWHTVKYDFVDGKYLYNRCHLIGFQLTGENANPNNLITCTRNMNAKVMLEFENKVADYVKKTKNHVLYRVTPIFEGVNLLATGVEMEAKSLEDDELEFNVFVFNVEDGVNINYLTGESSVEK